jgi:putative ABC transport system substrate-binding protein
VQALKLEKVTVPVVFVQVPDPVAVGFVAGLARPGGSMTGFTSFEYTIGGKWLELLKETAPRLTRAMFIRNNPAWSGLLGSIEAVAPKFGVQVTAADVRSAADIERAVASFATQYGGLIVQPDRITVVHRALIMTMAERHRLPAVYPFRFFAETGGLLSYGIDAVNVFRQAAGYVDRVLKGEVPADMPVQAPTRFELVINLRSRGRLGSRCRRSFCSLRTR